MSHSISSTANPRIAEAKHVATAAEPLKHLLTRVQDLVGQQEELSETRERLLIDRERFTTAGKRVRHQRAILGEAEANLMNAFREHHNSPTTLVPSDLSLAYQEVQDARNKLVELEDDCEHIQDTLGAAEWELMDMENELYQYELQQLVIDEAEQNTANLVETKPPTPVPPSTTISPSIKVQYQVAVLQHERLVEEFNRLRTSYSYDDRPTVTHGGITAGCPVRTELVDELIWEIMESEVKVRALKAELAPGEGPIISKYHTRSDAGTVSKPGPGIPAASPSSYSDGALRKVSDNVPYEQLVDFWLLDCLRTSGMEKIQYKSILKRELQYLNVTMMDVERWEGYARKLWPSSIVNVHELPGLTTSILDRIFRVQTHLDSVYETVNNDKDYFDLAVPRQGTHNSFGTQIPETIIQWFIRQPQPKPTSLQVDSAVFIDQIGAWAERDDAETTPARIETPESGEANSQNDMRNLEQHDTTGDNLCLAVQPETLRRSVQDCTTSTEQDSVKHNIYNFPGNGYDDIASTMISHKSSIEHSTPGSCKLIGPLEEWTWSPDDSDPYCDGREDEEDEQSCSNLVESSGPQHMISVVLQRLSPSSG
jgi:hypothetical protein